MCNIFRVCALFKKKKIEKRLYVGNQLAIMERFHSRGQQLWKFIGTEDRKEDWLWSATNKATVLYGGCHVKVQTLIYDNQILIINWPFIILACMFLFFFSNSDYVIFSMELVFCFFEDWLPTWPLYMADVNSRKNTL